MASPPLLCHRSSLDRSSVVRAEGVSSRRVALVLLFGAVFAAVLVNVFLEVSRGVPGDAHACVAVVGATRRQLRVNAGSSYGRKWNEHKKGVIQILRSMKSRARTE